MRNFLFLVGLLFVIPSTLLAKPFVIITAAKTAFDKTTEEDILRLYLGRSTSLKNTTASPVDYEDENALAQNFRERVLKKNPVQYRQYWARLLFTGKAKPPVANIKSEQEMIRYVQSNENAVGYISNQALAKDVKVLLVLDL